MNDRIRQFMSYKSLTSSELADNIGIQRSNLTHVLNGRNKPSFPFIAKLLETYPEINAKWLLLGQGNMIENDHVPESSDLFSEPVKPVEPPPVQAIHEPASMKEEEPAVYEKTANLLVNNEKEVERIVVFFSDQTFKSYTPSK